MQARTAIRALTRRAWPILGSIVAVATMQDSPRAETARSHASGHSEYDEQLLSSPRRLTVMLQIMAKEQCIRASDGCNVFFRYFGGGWYTPHVREGALLPTRPGYKTALILYLLPRPGIGNIGQTDRECPAGQPPRFHCEVYQQADTPTLDEEQPEPSLGPETITGTGVQYSWVNTADPSYRITCLSPDPEGVAGHLNRVAWQRTRPILSSCPPPVH